MTEQKSTYRQIFKATSIFGGVQVFKVVISVIKSKVIAVLLGPAGIGMLGLLTSALEMIKAIAGLGLDTGAVKEISEAAASENEANLSRTLQVLRRCVYITGAFGLLLTLGLSPLISQWTFGDRSYTWMFALLSVVVFINILSSGQLAALQGMRRLGHLAKVGVLGSFFGLLLSLPVFYFFPDQGIILFILLSSLIILIFSTYYARKLPYKKIKLSYRDTCKEGWIMAKLGIAMTVSAVIGIFTTYLIKTYITHHGGIDEAGLFQSAFAIAEGYFSLIFAAMATDYFPRLAAVNKDNQRMGDEVNKQTEIGMLIALPCLLFGLFFVSVLVQLLYSKDFLGAIPCIKWILLGNIFKIASWSLAYVLVATGKGVTFMVTNLISNLIIMGLTLTGFRFFGIEGTGMAYLGGMFLYFILMLILAARMFKIGYSGAFWMIFSIAVLLSVASFFLQGIPNPWIKYPVGVLFMAIGGAYSIRELNKRMDLKSLLQSKFKRREEKEEE